MRHWLIAVLMVLTLCLPSVHATCDIQLGRDKDRDGAPCVDPANPNGDAELLNDAITGGQPDLDWNLVDQSLLTPGNIAKIPPGEAKFEELTKPEQLSKLTKEQVLAQKGDWPKLDMDKLSDEAKSAIVAEMTDSGPEESDMETAPDTKVEDKGEYYKINHIPSLQTPKVKLTGAEEVKIYKDGCWDIEQASIIDFFGVSNTDVSNFDGCQDREYHIDSADSIRAGCFDARDVTNADIEINGNLILQTVKDTVFDIYYGFKNKMSYKSINNNNQLTFNPAACSIPFYQIEGINLTINTVKAIEQIEANNEAQVTLSRNNGVDCVDFQPTGTYTYTPNEIRDAFALKASQNPHKVCIKKEDKQDYELCEQCTIIDLTNNLIDINGNIEYLRLQYNDELDPINILSSGLTDYYQTLTPSRTQLLIESPLKIKANNPKADDELIITNWLTFTHFRDQRDAFINLQTQDYSLPLARVYQAPAFKPIEVDQDLIAAGNYLFYIPGSNSSNEFFRTLIQRRDLNYPTEAQS